MTEVFEGICEKMKDHVQARDKATQGGGRGGEGRTGGDEGYKYGRKSKL